MSDSPTIQPIRDRILIETVDPDAKIHSPSKFIVSTSAIDKIRRGRVLALGEGFLSPSGTPVGIAVSKGDVVLYEEGAGKTVHSYGKRYLILREQEVLAIEKEQGVQG